MSHYRLFFKNNIDGPLLGVEEIRARDDVEAVHLARERIGPQMLELWHDKRKVKHFAPAGDGLPVAVPQ